MKKEELLKHMAPCSLLCYTCIAYKEGIICQRSKELLHYTDGVYEFNKKHFSTGDQTYLQQFESFRTILKQNCNAQCDGCRGGLHNGCSIKGCYINECVKENHVDFCGECSYFPCGKVKELFEEEVYLQWLEGNNQIKKIGAQQYYEIKKTQSHYRSYI